MRALRHSLATLESQKPLIETFVDYDEDDEDEVIVTNCSFSICRQAFYVIDTVVLGSSASKVRALNKPNIQIRKFKNLGLRT